MQQKTGVAMRYSITSLATASSVVRRDGCGRTRPGDNHVNLLCHWLSQQHIQSARKLHAWGLSAGPCGPWVHRRSGRMEQIDIISSIGHETTGHDENTTRVHGRQAVLGR